MTADEVRKFRAALGLTQGQLAEQLGVTRQYVTLLETGRRQAGRSLAKLLRTLATRPAVRIAFSNN